METTLKIPSGITIDFEGLPQHIIDGGILRRFNKSSFVKDSDYIDWKNRYNTFIETVPEILIPKMLTKALEYGKKFQIDHNATCTTVNCVLDQSLQRRIAITEKMLAAFKDTVSYDLPILPITEAENAWLQTVNELYKTGSTVSFRELRAKLHQQLPQDFNPGKMDRRLISEDGEGILILGVIAVEKDFTIVTNINAVIKVIRNIILSTPEIRDVSISEIASGTGLTAAAITMALRLASDYGNFYSRTTPDENPRIYKTIDVGGNERVYYNYINFQGIEKIVQEKLQQASARPADSFTPEEIISYSQKLDEFKEMVMSEIQTLKNGQEIIYTDFQDEVAELKKFFSLGKKNWKQLARGKFFEIITGGVIDETISKRIGEFVNEGVAKLLQ